MCACVCVCVCLCACVCGVGTSSVVVWLWVLGFSRLSRQTDRQTDRQTRRHVLLPVAFDVDRSLCFSSPFHLFCLSCCRPQHYVNTRFTFHLLHHIVISARCTDIQEAHYRLSPLAHGLLPLLLPQDKKKSKPFHSPLVFPSCSLCQTITPHL